MKRNIRTNPVALLKADFMVVSACGTTFHFLVLSINGIKELIPLLDIILKWVNVSVYVYHRDVRVFVFSSHNSMMWYENSVEYVSALA